MSGLNPLPEVEGKTLYHHSLPLNRLKGDALLAVRLARHDDVIILWERHRVLNPLFNDVDEVEYHYVWKLIQVFSRFDRDLAIERAVDHAQSVGP